MYTPNCFYIRLLDLAEWNEFSRPTNTKIEGYYTTGIIQSSKILNNFRTIKMMGKNITIISDGDSEKTVRGDYKLRNEILQERDWCNYILELSQYNKINDQIPNNIK